MTAMKTQSKPKHAEDERRKIADAEHRKLIQETIDSSNRIKAGAEGLLRDQKIDDPTLRDLLRGLANAIITPHVDNFAAEDVVFGQGPRMRTERGHWGDTKIRFEGRDIAMTVYVGKDDTITMVGEFRSLRFSDYYQNAIHATGRNIFRLHISAEGVGHVEVKSSYPGRLTQIIDGLSPSGSVDESIGCVDRALLADALDKLRGRADGAKKKGTIMAMLEGYDARGGGNLIAVCLGEALTGATAK